MLKEHISILVQEVCEHVPEGAKNIVDGTAGHGGHVRAMGNRLISKTDAVVQIFGIDKDKTMIDRLTQQQADGKRS
jgi:16S rRNA C1402 N4-methylase RsmH